MKRLLIMLLLSFGLVHIGLSQNANDIKVKNSLSGVLVLTGEGGVTISQTDYQSKLGTIGKGSIEYFFDSYSNSNFGLKVFGGYGNIAGSATYLVPAELKTSISMIGAGLSFTIAASDVVYPYFSASLVHLWVTPKDNNGVAFSYPFKIMALYGETGVRFMVGQNVSINFLGGLMFANSDGNEDNLDGNKQGLHNDWVGTATFGLSYYIGRNKDTDGDGVIDSKDMCPGTLMGVKVDEFGCPVDSDNDGIADYLDKCPNTPAGVKVDSNGCPLDSDNDGVADYLDKCSNTPAGVSVDNNGCPLDADNDGVADYLDKCPNTPAGVSVDNNGCPLDSDGDGVPDYLDKCPNTPQGREVDADGCTVKKVVQVEIMGSDALFDFNKFTLKPKAYDKLNSITETLKNNMDYSVRIEGYTDAIGSDAYNMKLSERRAQAVANYLISKGINKNRLEIIPLGESNPIASNKTVAGRAANRRVEIKISQ